jgi:putative membrane protein
MSGMRDRHPRWVYDAGEEPDPRFTLANERTFLAWVRTAIAMLAGGVALHALRWPGSTHLRTTLAVVLVLFGGATCGLALVRWARVERAMRHRQPLPAFTLGFLMTAVVLVGAVLLALSFL